MIYKKFKIFLNENSDLKTKKMYIYTYGIVPEGKFPNPYMKSYDNKIAELIKVDYSILPNHPYLIKFVEDGKLVWVNGDSIKPYNTKRIFSDLDPYGEEDWD